MKRGSGRSPGLDAEGEASEIEHDRRNPLPSQSCPCRNPARVATLPASQPAAAATRPRHLPVLRAAQACIDDPDVLKAIDWAIVRLGNRAFRP